ncbi:MAG: DNA mismatch repair endonuclease MutL [Planctomycetota bacterium]
MPEPVIRVLPREVVNRIAAGEVVERPASVVKELVENAIDAGATRVEVEVTDGGRSRIRIIDDGIGMGPDDLGLAFVAHATSKLTDVDDLLHIGTLGFRGEALASIGAVSRTRILSRPHAADRGHEVVNDFGTVGEIRPAASAAGTEVDVADLFRNVPARAQFLKSVRAEMARVTETMHRLGVSNPEVAFRLSHGGRHTAHFPAGMGQRERIARAYGRDLLDEMLEAEGEAGGIHLKAYLGPPSRTWADSSRMQFFLNGRHVKDRTILHAARHPYEDLIFGRRYPAVFLFLTMDPALVDQNVHPAKLEVRFRDASGVHALVRRTLRGALTEGDLAHPIPLPPPETGERQERVREAIAGFESRREEERPSAGLFDRPAAARGGAPAPRPLAEAIEFLQARHSFLVLEDEGGITIVDQHALHERVLYDRIRARFRGGDVETQRLLRPVVVEVSPVEAGRLLDAREALAAAGLLVEPFGEDGVAVQGLPAAAAKADPASVVSAILSGLAEEREVAPEELVEDVLASMACRAAVKAGDRLTREQVRELLAEAEDLEHAGTCPHGRPTTLRLTFEALERHFRRMG